MENASGKMPADSRGVKRPLAELEGAVSERCSISDLRDLCEKLQHFLEQTRNIVAAVCTMLELRISNLGRLNFARRYYLERASRRSLELASTLSEIRTEVSELKDSLSFSDFDVGAKEYLSILKSVLRVLSALLKITGWQF
ncbi:uncharacterized protein LOC131234367 isoform X2 [Magnolia sinica]|uniref:uncharacterized protein LOC131234367 isoform X2 n=1 Tax=Magnolia sinica TaxID=86752 RepID=UPI002659E8A9|nr:uncharacterized protein LOC131234367 isoform X2 [Magnolia sinica]XP_058087177.1 uncharacterized protein LOC131234367 isoform X2 [Magnolia sinica]